MVVSSTNVEPPWVHGLPLVGCLPAMRHGIDRFFVENYRRHGPVYQFRVFHMHGIVLAGPEANLFVARSKAKLFRSREIWDGLRVELDAQHLLMAADGDEHRHLRKVETRGYSRAAADGRVKEVIDVVRREIGSWPLGAPVLVMPAVKRIIAEQLGIVAANFSPVDHIDDLLLFARLVLRTKVTGELPQFVLRLPPYRRAKARIYAMARRAIAAHREHPPDESRPRDLLDDLIAAHDADPKGFNEADMLAATLGPFVAGLDTAANMLGLLMYTLHQHHEVLQLARDEADTFFARGDFSLDAVRTLDVITRALLETMRLYPIAPGMMRWSHQTFEFAGRKIPAGNRLFLATTVTHHLEEFFPNPERFDIDRFSAARAEHRRPGLYAPYGLGPHACLGSSLSDLLLILSAASILHKAKLASMPGYKLAIKRAPTPTPTKAFALRFVARR